MTSSPLATERDPRWNSVRARDKAADGAFVYAVRTTGIYCRPSCPSRRANPANVVFFPDAGAAEAAGFRACLRCAPAGPSPGHAALIARACQMLDTTDPVPKLRDLAAGVGLSPYHFHRVFKAATGLTPHAWAAARRADRMRRALDRPDDSVTDAIYAAGYTSNSRFYEKSDALLGMTPKQFRAGGADVDIRFAVGQCTLGAILVAQSARGICAITLGDDPGALVRDLQDRFPKANLIGADPAFEARVAQVVGFVEAPQLGLNLPLDMRGTAFQERVWQALRRIPLGQTASYADIARAIGQPRAVRAVAQACGANRIAVAIPCHRVVRTDGAMSGYRWGVARKRTLLDREVQA
ncbi:MAG TPA: bifunctional DNA-binding transcriptional regulator/O6-methylguanine-DNA methyltransferase Ada [Paenirhodobacter sp.]